VFIALKAILMSGVALMAGAVGLGVYKVTGKQMFPTLLGAWIVLGLCGAALVPWLARAFVRFDVTRDTPA
jgi:hypothetical protein